MRGCATITAEHGALLISDEVMTGFRVSPSGWYGLDPVDADLFTFGKVMSGGLPAAAFGGRAEVMARLAPAGPVYQAGTLSGNPGGGRRRARDAAQLHRRTSTRSSTPGPRRSAGWRQKPLPHKGFRIECSTPATCSRCSSARSPVTNFAQAQAAAT